MSPAASLVASAPSKSGQILGGTSALDQIRERPAGTAASHPLFSRAPYQKFEPAAAPATERRPFCAIEPNRFSVAIAGTTHEQSFAAISRNVPTDALLAAAKPADLVLGSRMVPISRTGFDAQWRRVSTRRANLSATLIRLDRRGDSRGELLASVNRWVNREIDHAEDIDLFGRSDYWADAATTLRLGRGDCEDFALLKMELLAAAGIAREDMILTLARDLIRRQDHAVLLVKSGEGYVMLDNVGSAPLDASQDHGYRPVMSLGAKQSWLHGY